MVWCQWSQTCRQCRPTGKLFSSRFQPFCGKDYMDLSFTVWWMQQRRAFQQQVLFFQPSVGIVVLHLTTSVNPLHIQCLVLLEDVTLTHKLNYHNCSIFCVVVFCQLQETKPTVALVAISRCNLLVLKNAAPLAHSLQFCSGRSLSKSRLSKNSENAHEHATHNTYYAFILIQPYFPLCHRCTSHTPATTFSKISHNVCAPTVNMRKKEKRGKGGGGKKNRIFWLSWRSQ